TPRSTIFPYTTLFRSCARYGADIFGSISNIEARAIYSSEFLLKAVIPHADNMLYIFITQSGETSDTNKALIKAKQFGVRTLCVRSEEHTSELQSRFEL